MKKNIVASDAPLFSALVCCLLFSCSNDSSHGVSAEAGVAEDGGASGSGGSGGQCGAGGKPNAGGSTNAGGSATGGRTAASGAAGMSEVPSAGGSAGGRGGAKPDSGIEDAGRTDAGAMKVALHFKAKVGSADFACGRTYPAQGSTKVAVEPRDFRFYVEDVRLLDEAGAAVPLTLDERTPWQTPDVALLDFEDGKGACVDGNSEMNDVVTGTVPSGKYSGVLFVNGVPDALNHGDPLQAPAPLQVGTMTWGWLFGFKFVKAELGAATAPAGDAEPGLGLIHLGSTGCTNVADGSMPNFMEPPIVQCSQPNRNEVRLTGFDPGVNTIVADIGALFGGVDLSVSNQCHSEGASCPTEFGALGLDYTTGARTTQSVYRME
jgi:uncharacterized repeat protein (TIGR04052 family)